MRAGGRLQNFGCNRHDAIISCLVRSDSKQHLRLFAIDQLWPLTMMQNLSAARMRSISVRVDKIIFFLAHFRDEITQLYGVCMCTHPKRSKTTCHVSALRDFIKHAFLGCLRAAKKQKPSNANVRNGYKQSSRTFAIEVNGYPWWQLSKGLCRIRDYSSRR